MSDRVIRWSTTTDGWYYLEERGEITGSFQTKEDLKDYLDKNNLWEYMKDGMR